MIIVKSDNICVQRVGTLRVACCGFTTFYFAVRLIMRTKGVKILYAYNLPHLKRLLRCVDTANLTIACTLQYPPQGALLTTCDHIHNDNCHEELAMS